MVTEYTWVDFSVTRLIHVDVGHNTILGHS
jgi:hypothetical protein